MPSSVVPRRGPEQQRIAARASAAISQSADTWSKAVSAPKIGAVRVPLHVERLALAREMHVVELVVAELEEEFAVVVLRCSTRSGLPKRTRVSAVDAVEPDADFAPIAEIAAEVEIAPRLRGRENPRLADSSTKIGRSRASTRALGATNHGPRRVERLVELADDLRVAADLQVGQPAPRRAR